MKHFISKRNKHKEYFANQALVLLITKVIVGILSFIWLLAVLKVYLLDLKRNSHRGDPDQLLGDPSRFNIFARSPLEINPIFNRNGDEGVKTFISLYDEKKRNLSDKGSKVVVPTSSEWAQIRASPDYRVSGNREDGNTEGVPYKNVIEHDIVQASALVWPPVQHDGTILATDGIDIMPVIGLKVPRFYLPDSESEMNKVGSKVNGQDTIFLMIASYRDFQCRETITSAYMRSDHPERLFIGAVDQVVPGDIGCLDIDIPCSVDDTQPICKYRDQISVFKMDAMYATGPVTARHVGDRMYRGQTFVMQMDAHCQFVNSWDTQIISQWTQTQNEMAVLSSYLSDVQESISPAGDSLRKTRPIMCNSFYEGDMPARYLRHGSQPERKSAIKDMPQLEPYWAAGFSFSRGHFKLRVPYDAYQPMVFQGEEINVGIRGFTHGYDFYAPRDSVVFHEYAQKSSRRKKIPMFWENSDAHKGEAQKSLMRATAVIGMAPDIDPDSYDHSELGRYGIGNVRSLELFYKLFLVDPVKRASVQLCPFVADGVMHREFQKYLRPDHLGLDYSFLEDFDTQAELNRIAEEEPMKDD